MSSIIAFVSALPMALTSYNTLDSIFEAASSMLTWVLNSITSILTVIAANPLILVLFFITLISFAVGLLFRIWRSVG